MMNRELINEAKDLRFDLAWYPDHAYNDFVCIETGADWDPVSRAGEILRIEAKSMYLGADESKGHFDVLQHELGEHDLLLVLIWAWQPLDPGNPRTRVAPLVVDSFIDVAIPIARLRDQLHIARGGSFVSPEACPNHCVVKCVHVGEPLNADGKRERRSGPDSCKPANTSYAANFGGLVRMLKTSSTDARNKFREIRKECETSHKYISFIHKNFPQEENNQYLAADWRKAALSIGLPIRGQSIDSVRKAVREKDNYLDILRALTLDGFPEGSKVSMLPVSV
jgi:hypothetical protein